MTIEPICDTHAHLDFQQFDADREEVIARARGAGVRWMVNPGADLESSQRAIHLAESQPGIYAAVGVHPHEAQTMTPVVLEELRRLAQHSKVMAIGEIGLDYYRDLSPRHVQQVAFRQQLDLASELELPIIIHDRDAHDDVMAILGEWQGKSQARGVFHAFSGDGDLADRVIEMGYLIAVGGPLTFQNARRMAVLASALPLDRMVVETDCPYLTPHPHRGQRNEPAYLPLVVERLAGLKGLSVDQVARQTSMNALTLFGIRDAMPQQ
jgi:TatD DNase family protein